MQDKAHETKTQDRRDYEKPQLHEMVGAGDYCGSGGAAGGNCNGGGSSGGRCSGGGSPAY